MLIRHCDNCDRIYQGDKTGRDAFVCKYCSAECENIFYKLSKVARRLEVQGQYIHDLPIEDLVEETRVLKILVQIVMDEGHFKRLDLSNVNTCSKCKKVLEDKTTSLCETCTRVFSEINDTLQDCCI